MHRAAFHGDPGPDPGDLGQRAGFGGQALPLAGQRGRRFRAAGVQGRAGRGDQPPGPVRLRRGEPRRAFQRGRGGGVPEALPGAVGGLLERCRDPLVRAGRGGRAVPGAPVRVRLAGQRIVQRAGQRGVSRAAFGGRRALVDGGPDERVPERHRRRVRGDQPGPLGRVGRRRGDAEGLRRAPDQAQVTGLLRRRHQQERPGRGGQGGHLAVVGLLQAAGQRQRRGELQGRRQRDRDPRTLGQRRGQLEQGQRVPVRLGQHPVGERRRQAGGALGEQGAGRLAAEPAERQFGQAGSVEAILTGGGEQDDALGFQPPRREQQRVGGGTVQPVGVVDQQSRAPSPASSDSSDRAARPIRNRSAPGVPARPNAPRSACACGGGSTSSRPSPGRSSSCSAANGSSASDSMPVPRSTRIPAAAAA